MSKKFKSIKETKEQKPIIFGDKIHLTASISQGWDAMKGKTIDAALQTYIMEWISDMQGNEWTTEEWDMALAEFKVFINGLDKTLMSGELPKGNQTMKPVRQQVNEVIPMSPKTAQAVIKALQKCLDKHPHYSIELKLVELVCYDDADETPYDAKFTAKSVDD